MLQKFTTFLASLYLLGKKEMSHYCEPVTGGGKILVTPDGALLSFIEVDGARFVINSKAAHADILEQLKYKLATFFKNDGHVLQWVLDIDVEHSKHIVKKHIQPLTEGAEKAGLDVDDLNTARASFLSSRIFSEKSFIAVWSRPSRMGKKERIADREEYRNQYQTVKALFGQKADPGLRRLVIHHNGFLEAVQNALDVVGVSCNSIFADAGFAEVRGMIYPYLKSSKWKPAFPNTSKPQARLEEDAGKGDASGLLPPILSEQLFVHSSEVITTETIRIGHNLWSYVNMTIGPETPQPFDELVRLINSSGRIPWRVMLQLEGGGLKHFALNSVLAAFSSVVTKYVNARIIDAANRLDKLRKKGESIVQLRLTAATWAHHTEARELDTRVSQLMNALEGWGNTTVAADVGDPLPGVLGSVPGLSPQNAAAKAILTLEEALTIFPYSRAGSPWKNGAVLYCTEDGKPFPFDQGSSLQQYWTGLDVGEPGSGKSLKFNQDNMAFVQKYCRELSEGELPYLGIIDIGISSKGLISALQRALPKNRQHEVAHVKWTLEAKSAVNMFDTPLGLRIPPNYHKKFLVSFLYAYIGAEGNTGDVNSMYQFLELVVDEAYRLFSDDVEPTQYELATEPEIDQLVTSGAITVEQNPTWWEVTDALFEAGYIHEATLAQRHAVPTPSKLVRASNAQSVSAEYERVVWSGDEKIIDAFSRMLSAATRMFPNLSSHTRWDIGSARIIAFDLSAVVNAEDQSDQAKRQKEIMYIAADQIIAGEWFQSEDDYSEVAPLYKKYHLPRVRVMKRTAKRLAVDEYHQTGSGTAIEHIMDSKARLGRKHNVHLNISTQFITDLSENLLSLMTNVCIMRVDSKTRNEIEDRFDVPKDVGKRLKNFLTGPSSKGAPFFGVFRTNKGEFQHLLYSLACAFELWLLTTNPKDVGLRDAVERKLGSGEAIQFLAKQFPKGTAVDQLEAKETEMSETGRSGDPTETLAEEIIGLSYA